MLLIIIARIYAVRFLCRVRGARRLFRRGGRGCGWNDNTTRHCEGTQIGNSHKNDEAEHDKCPLKQRFDHD